MPFVQVWAEKRSEQGTFWVLRYHTILPLGGEAGLGGQTNMLTVFQAAA